MSTPHTISTGSLEYVKVPVRAKASGAYPNITTDTVTMAFKAEGSTPSGGDFKTASWETDATTDPDTYYARCLVGTGGDATLAAGVYRIWVKVADAPETPLLKSGLLVVT